MLPLLPPSRFTRKPQVWHERCSACGDKVLVQSVDGKLVEWCGSCQAESKVTTQRKGRK